MLVPVIMAGGAGSRLWPLSRQLSPKQFLPLVDSDTTMLQATIARLEGLEHCAPIVICNEQHRFLAAEQLRQFGKGRATILLEPFGRNTAPAITLAALQSMKDGDDPLLLVLAADHLIEDLTAYHDAIAVAAELALQDRLVTFGIVPTHAETGYGYVEQGARLENGGFEVTRFVEKPDLATATNYLESGRYLWNSGMFLFRASRYLREIQQHAPEVHETCFTAFESAARDMDFTRIAGEVFVKCPDISVDYAVMEHAKGVCVVPLDAGWNDIGSWSALWETAPKDEQGNVAKGDTLLVQSKGSYVHASHRLVATVGIENLIVVETKDAVLVADKRQVQSVKQVVDRLKAVGRSESSSHREVYRPWGKYDSIDSGTRYQVKRITVEPGAKLSVQMHHHRAEHWIVVSGTARVTNGDKTYLVTENQSTYIPMGEIHALENPGVISLELIEVQSGSYLGEDDIVRFRDLYGRV